MSSSQRFIKKINKTLDNLQKAHNMWYSDGSVFFRKNLSCNSLCQQDKNHARIKSKLFCCAINRIIPVVYYWRMSWEHCWTVLHTIKFLYQFTNLFLIIYGLPVTPGDQFCTEKSCSLNQTGGNNLLFVL